MYLIATCMLIYKYSKLYQCTHLLRNQGSEEPLHNYFIVRSYRKIDVFVLCDLSPDQNFMPREEKIKEIFL